MRTREVPRTGEALPVVGLGTWRTFDVAPEEAAQGPQREVMRAFLAAGGRVVDTSPMYGRAEEATGAVVAALEGAPRPFLATKVWTSGEAEGRAQIAESMRRLRTERLDLLQIHNLLDWQVQLATLRDLKAAGTIRYTGITHYAPSAFDRMEAILRGEGVDFVQLPYSAATREAEARLLPAAAETGTAVLVMRPLEEGSLLAATRGRPLPPWAAELGARTWSEVLLAFVLSHPAVTAALPATASPAHLAENVAAGDWPLPDAALRRRMERDLSF